MKPYLNFRLGEQTLCTRRGGWRKIFSFLVLFMGVILIYLEED